MNEIYWHDKRSLSSKQISIPPPPTQPRRAYESSSTHRTPSSSYTPYSSERQSNFPYTSSLYGVYRQTTPSIVTSPVPLHPSSNRYQPQQRQISRSLSEDYYTRKYQNLDGFYHDGVYTDDDEETSSSGYFNYTFGQIGVSE